MGSSLIRYDIAISFAEEDAFAADELYRHLKKRCIKTYNYRFANQIMDNLHKITLRIFRNRSRFIVVFISHHYARRKWTNIEWQTIRKAKIDRKYKGVILIRLDGSNLPGLSEGDIYMEWNDNPKELSKQIIRKMKDKGFSTLCKVKLMFAIGMLVVVGLLIAVIIS